MALTVAALPSSLPSPRLGGGSYQGASALKSSTFVLIIQSHEFWLAGHLVSPAMAKQQASKGQ
jgi:hypothetical protein